MNEVHRPHFVGEGDHFQRLGFTLWNSFLGSSGKVQAEFAVNTINSLVVPEMTLISEAMIALPEAPAAMLVHYFIESINERLILVLSIWRWLIPT